jgi:type IV pilus assembly protein PilF
MKRALLLLIEAGALAAALAGCAAPHGEGPKTETGTIVGEVGDPRNRARVHTELAALYFERGNMGVALEELRLATAADAQYAPAYSLFGLVYMDLKETRLAEDNFQRALALSPGDPEINHSYGWFLCQSGREADSIAYFLRAVRNPLYARPWVSYSAAGVCSLRKDKLKDADDFFQRALRLNADEPTALLNLAALRYNQGRVDDARRLITRYNKLVTPSAESLWLGLRIERQVGGRIAEQSYAEQLRRRFPGSPQARALERGDYDYNRPATTERSR